MNKILFTLILFIFTMSAWATCTSPISRSTFSPNTTIRSSLVNTQFDTVYNHVNNMDGDCIQDSSLPASKIDTTTVPSLVYAIKEGCKVSYSDANTLAVGKCIISINGNYIKTTSNTTVTWGCSSCSAEVSSTTYYLYATSASSLTLKISTTAPGEDGYNGTDRALARFYNDASSAIDQYSIDNWRVNSFVPANGYLGALTTTGSWVSNATYAGKYYRVGSKLKATILVSCTGAPTATTLTLTLPSSLSIDTAKLSIGADTLSAVPSTGEARDSGINSFGIYAEYSGTATSISVMVWGAAASYINRAGLSNTAPITLGNGDTVQLEYEVPIVGWND
jgi:hypothetical protein